LSRHVTVASLLGDAAALSGELCALADGEVGLLDSAGIPNFEEMRDPGVCTRGELVTYFAFDLLFLNGRDLRVAAARRASDTSITSRWKAS
jgi:ATP-dependent DNA ligase